MLAERIEVVAVEAARAAREAGAELLGEHAIAEPLGLFDLVLTRREARGEVGGADKAAVAGRSATWLGRRHMPP